MLKKINRIFVVQTTNTVVFYSYYSSGKHVKLVEVPRSENLWECGEEALQKLPEELHASFISAFLRAMKRACNDPLILGRGPYGEIAIFEADGRERLRGHPEWDLNDLISYLKTLKGHVNPKEREYARDMLQRLFFGMRRFNNRRGNQNK